ncbi:MAG: alpha/beta hydrolase [Pirellulales bacterium]|nr:alpha/beta hydrolase [Pirellulales bacterium]
MRISVLFLVLTASCLVLPSLAKDQSFDSDGVKIRYTDEGSGPPVVLIHGYTASGDMNWRIPGIIAPLARQYRVITIDNRGHGLSDKPTSPGEYGAVMAEDIVRLLDHLEIDSAHLVGYSMGGMITLKVLATHPERVRSGLIGGMGWIELAESSREDSTAGEELKPLQACAQGFPTLGITREQLTAIQQPIEVVIGSNDGLLERRVDPLLEVRPDVPVVEIEGANHVTCVFRKEFRQAIIDFLAEQSADDAQQTPQ